MRREDEVRREGGSLFRFFFAFFTYKYEIYHRAQKSGTRTGLDVCFIVGRGSESSRVTKVKP